MEKRFFVPGELVRVKHDIQNRPVMVVDKKVTSLIKNIPMLLGIKCFWFSDDKKLQVGIFSTKDLEHTE